MRDEWPRIQLGQVAADEDGAIAIGPFGSRMKANVYVPFGIPVIRGTNISQDMAFKGNWVYVTSKFADKMPNCIVRTGDLVFPHRGAIGEVALIGSEHGKMIISTSMMKYRPNPKLADSRFLFYYFRSPEGRSEILKFSSQVGTPGIGQPLTSLRQFNIPLPSLPIQQEIAEILSSLDIKIEHNRCMNETLEAITKALFKNWFVDFDPVIDNAIRMGNLIPDEISERAEMRRTVLEQSQNADANNTPAFHYLFPNEFEFTEEMGWIPSGWMVKSVDKAIEVNPRVQLKKNTIAPFIDMKALPTSGFSVTEITGKPYSGGTKFINGDVLLARITPCLENGKTGIVDFLEGGEIGFGSTEFIVLRGKKNIKTPYIACLARYPGFRDHCIQSMVGSSGRQRVQNDSLSNFFLALPTKPGVLEKFNGLTRNSFEKITQNSKQGRLLSRIRDTLLPKLLSGEIRIPEAEKIVEAAE